MGDLDDDRVGGEGRIGQDLHGEAIQSRKQRMVYP